MTHLPVRVFALAVLAPCALEAQGVAVGAARWFSSPHASLYQVSVDGFGMGALSFQLGGEYLRQTRDEGARWLGGTGQLILRTTPAAQPYLLLGGALGAGHRQAGGGYGLGIGVYTGAGFELFAVGPIGLQAEGLYQWRSAADLRGLTIGLRLGSRIGREAAVRAAPTPVTLPSASPEDERILSGAASAGPSTMALGLSIVETALSVMGTPYRWGGSDQNGFDCSGLIQYSYGQHGLTLPRRSVEQAATGREVARDSAALVPGDILAFAATPGGQVTHVGLYIGEGRFIHSASDGVRTSRLSPDDPSGRWFWDRWVGARRVLGSPQ
jgi:cell wall-associated NlpC family hydrolase